MLYLCGYSQYLICFYNKNDKNIHPFRFIENAENPDCTAALLRFVKHLDVKSVEKIIDGIPENFQDMQIIAAGQKEHNKAVFHMMLNKSIFPAAENFLGRNISL